MNDIPQLRALSYELRHQADIIEMGDNMASTNGMLKVARRLKNQANAVDRAIEAMEGASDD
jgi:hypothetical protein